MDFTRASFLILAAALLGAAAPTSVFAQTHSDVRALAKTVTIYRDRYGIPHVFATTDSGATFGFGYAQAEDDFARLEDNYIRALGRAAEVHGEQFASEDRLNRLLEIPRLAQAEYRRLDPHTRSLVNGFASGVNEYLRTHTSVHARLLARIEPWYSLAFIRYNYYQNGFVYASGIRPQEVRVATVSDALRDNVGSNGWVIGPSRSASGHAMLFINPHLPWFGPGRVYEGHLHSDQGWDFTGYTRLGFPIPYVGHNATLGWVSTDNNADVSDLYRETFDDASHPLAYRYGASHRTATEWHDTIRVRTATGMDVRVLTLRKTHHGPIVTTRNGQPLALRMAKLGDDGWLAEWYAMTHARSVAELKRAMAPLAMSFGNVMAADSRGHTWYLYNGAVPRRDSRFDWGEPVDGGDPATEWKGFLKMDELPSLTDPATGWMQNCNTSPFLLTDRGNPDSSRYAPYIVRDGDNPRGQRSRRILAAAPQWTFDAWMKIAFDQTIETADTMRALVRNASDAYLRSNAAGANAQRVRDMAAEIERWDGRGTADAIAPSLLYFWRLRMNAIERRTGRSDASSTATERVDALIDAADTLTQRFGQWRVQWGDLMRIQRVNDIDGTTFDDAAPSLPLVGAPGVMGSVFTFAPTMTTNTKRLYGTAGGTYISVVEFGPGTPARAVHVFGASGDPASPHFTDQMGMYVRGEMRPTWTSLADVKANAERAYHPGDTP